MSSDEKFDEFTVLFIGSRWQKGADFVPHIINSTLKRDKSISFILVGGVASLPALRSQLEKLKEKYPHISFVSSLSDEDLRELYSKSHLFLFPSRYEGFGNVVLEAQSCGLPVLAFNIAGAPRDVIVDGITGSLVAPYDLDAMAKEIVRYHVLWEKDPETYRKISLEARERALKFDWSNVVAKIHLCLSEIVHKLKDKTCDRNG